MDDREAIRGLTIDEIVTPPRKRGRPPGPVATHCRKGHEFTPENTYTYSNGAARRPSRRCVTCARESVKAWIAKNPERAKELQRASALRRPFRDPNRERTQRLKRYGLTSEAFEAILKRQGYTCPICGVRLTTDKQLGKDGKLKLRSSSAVVDHCHTTLKVRGVICMMCNKGLGSFVDNPAALRAAADYLEASRSG